MAGKSRMGQGRENWGASATQERRQVIEKEE
jgi:hypothetical protein